MRVAVTSRGNSPLSLSDQRFGRAPFFLIHDSTDNQWTTVENRGADESHGSGLAAAQVLIDLGVDAVVTGRCGPKASALLLEAGISVHEGFSGTVVDGPAAISAGRLTNRPQEGPSGMKGGEAECE